MLWTAMILGLAGGFHCIGMCGPIGLMLPVNKKSKLAFTFQILIYHLGRITAYFTIGLFFGMIGKGLYLAGFQQRLSILMGVAMILIVLIPTSVFNKYNFSKPIYFLINGVKKKLSIYLQKKTKSSVFLIGFFNGYLPCGLVYMALIGSVSMANAWLGGAYMAIFGLGTIPLLAIFIFAGNFINLSFRNKIQKLVPVFVVIVGLLFILRGLGIGIPYVSPSNIELQISNNPENCVTIEKTK